MGGSMWYTKKQPEGNMMIRVFKIIHVCIILQTKILFFNQPVDIHHVFFHLFFIPVTERSEDTGLVYPLSVVRRAERSKFTMKDYFSFEEQRAIAEKLILATSGQKKSAKKKSVHKIK